MQDGFQQWNRSNITIVGDGSAGKTSLVRAMCGLEYAEQASTLGMDQSLLQVLHSKGWKEAQECANNLEDGVAGIILRHQQQGAAAGRGDNAAEGDGEQKGEGQKPQTKPKPSSSSQSPRGQSSTSPLSAASSGQGSSATRETAAAAAAVAVKGSVKAEFVVKQLAEKRVKLAASSSIAAVDAFLQLVISDFGGQKVFASFQHLFIRKNGVFVVVFNMEWLLQDSTCKQRCLEYLRFWLNSIYMHTVLHNSSSATAEDGEAARVVIVGTRKDKVSDPRVHQQISNAISTAFNHCPFWESVLENEDGVGPNGKMHMCFFPVDNKCRQGGGADPTIGLMQAKIEAELQLSPFVTQRQPLSWFGVVDALLAEKNQERCFLPYAEVSDMCAKRGIEVVDELPRLLSFLHEMGIVFWLPEDTLRDIVILDVVKAFVKPATLLVCKHQADGEDDVERTHVLKIHRDCQNKHGADWADLLQLGIVSEALLEALLKGFEATYAAIVHLMVKFALLVRIDTFDDSYSSAPSFLVPALLPVAKKAVGWSSPRGGTAAPVTSLFVFSSSARVSKELQKEPTITGKELAEKAFFPQGFFERLVCKVFEWSQMTSKAQKDICICREYAELSFGGNEFRLAVNWSLHCIELSVSDGSDAAAVHCRVQEQIQKVLAEAMHSLRFFSVVPISGSSGSAEAGALFGLNSVFVSFDKLEDLVKVGLMSGGGKRALLGADEAKQLRSRWRQSALFLPEYDVFVSYRWAADDSLLAKAIYDSASAFLAASGSRRVAVFLDSQRLQEGEPLQQQFIKALSNSLVVTPLVTAQALQRMRTHDPQAEDNVLIEWMVAMECVASSKSRLAKIYPLMMGSVVNRGGSSGSEGLVIGDLFAEGALAALPATVPAASTAKATQLLRAMGLEPRPGHMEGRTVRDVVGELVKFLGFRAWDVKRSSRLAASFADKVWDVLQSCDGDGDGVGAGAGAAVAASSPPHDAKKLPAAAAAAAAAVSGPTAATAVVADVHGDGGVNEVEAWLRSIKLGEYWPHFQSRGFDDMSMLSCLKELSEEEVVEELDLLVCMPRKLHRVQLFKKISELS